MVCGFTGNAKKSDRIQNLDKMIISGTYVLVYDYTVFLI